MPKTEEKPTKSRLNLEMSQGVRERLDKLHRETDANSLTDVIRKAIAVYEVLWQEKNNGATLISRDRNGFEKQIILVEA